MKTNDLIFVFGSNLAGRHGKGAALHAQKYRGAQQGVGVGLSGGAYALPTKDDSIQTLPLGHIREHVETFKTFAKSRPDLTFQVTRVGCGLAGYTDDQIAPLFLDAPDNCLLPGLWEKMRTPELVRIIIAGSRDMDGEEAHKERCQAFLNEKMDRLTSKMTGKKIEVVSGTARGADRMGEAWAILRGHKIVRFPAEWDRFKKPAGHIRNALMSWYGTHLGAFWDMASPGTKSMIELARQDGLMVRIVDINPALESTSRASVRP